MTVLRPPVVSDLSVAGAKKSASFYSSHSLAGELAPGALVHSLVSMPSGVGMMDADTEGRHASLALSAILTYSTIYR